MNQVTCPHCGAISAAGAFCQSCGKALPAAMPTGPRVVSGADMASTPAGQKLQADELHKTAKKARGALLAVAILSTVFLVIGYFLLSRTPGVSPDQVTEALIRQGIVVALFWGLYIWSRSQPLPAAIIGLIAYCTLLIINVVQTLQLAAEQRSGFGGIGIGIVDIIIIVVLSQAISAGTKHRKLQAQMALR